MHEFAMSRSVAYAAPQIADARLVLLSITLSLYRASRHVHRDAHRAALARHLALRGMSACVPSVFEHAWQVAHVTVKLTDEMTDWELISERQLRSIVILHDELLASAQVGQVAYSHCASSA